MYRDVEKAKTHVFTFLLPYKINYLSYTFLHILESSLYSRESIF